MALINKEQRKLWIMMFRSDYWDRYHRLPKEYEIQDSIGGVEDDI